MTTTTADTSLKPCRCGCGTLVKGTYARGHWARSQKQNRGIDLLPGPDDDIDVGEAIPQTAEADPEPWTDDEVPDWVLNGGPPPPLVEPDEDVQPDRPPGHLSSPRAGKGAGAPKKVRATAAIRKDVHAKIRFILVPATQTWQMRDQMCGGVAVQQEPEISEALAEIVCDSPDLLNWFTGPAGGFMRYFRLLMAIQPIALTVYGHHLAHGMQPPPNATLPPQPAYAA